MFERGVIRRFEDKAYRLWYSEGVSAKRHFDVVAALANFSGQVTGEMIVDWPRAKRSRPETHVLSARASAILPPLDVFFHACNSGLAYLLHASSWQRREGRKKPTKLNGDWDMCPGIWRQIPLENASDLPNAAKLMIALLAAECGLVLGVSFIVITTPQGSLLLRILDKHYDTVLHALGLQHLLK